MSFYAVICRSVFVNEKNEKMKRERYVDIVKGLSILCITLLHYENGIFPSYLNVFIGSFMITTFYVTSGWISAMHPSNHSIKELIQKRWKQLGIPYLWWTVIILIFDFVLWWLGYYDKYFIGRELYKSIILRGIGTLWFLPALFGGEIIWIWLRKQNKVWIILLVLILTLCYQYYYHYFFASKTEIIYRIIDAPFHTVSNILGAWVGIAFGFYSFNIFKKRLYNVSYRYKLGIIGLILCIFSFITANYLPLFLSPLGGLFAPLFGPLGWLLLAKTFQDSKLLDYLNYWGLNSLNLMVTHYSIVMVLFSIIIEKGFGKSFNGWITIICFLLSLPIQYLLVIVINRHAKFTLGK